MNAELTSDSKTSFEVEKVINVLREKLTSTTAEHEQQLNVSLHCPFAIMKNF